MQVRRLTIEPVAEKTKIKVPTSAPVTATRLASSDVKWAAFANLCTAGSALGVASPRKW